MISYLLWHIFLMVTSFIGTLLVFMWVMPKKEKMKAAKWYQFLPRKIAGFLGFLVDVAWNIFYGTIIHAIFMLDSSADVMPPFKKVTNIEKIYELTLTKRLQQILDLDPVDSTTYKMAYIMYKVLNKYDPDHLTLRAIK